MAEFSWAAAEDVGFGLVGGLSKGLNALGAAQIAKANAYAKEVMRKANNQLAASSTQLASTVRNINNNRILEAGAEQVEVLRTNAIRTADSVQSGKFEQSIRDAEQWGHAAAGAAAQGLGGAGVRAIGIVNSLQMARRREMLNSRGEQIAADSERAGTGTMSRALQSLQQGPLQTRQSFGVQSVQTPNIAQYLLAGLLDKKDSLHTMLGSLYTQPTSEASAAEAATTSPVYSGTVTATDLPPGISPYEDTQRFYNRQPPPYANSIDVQAQTTRN